MTLFDRFALPLISTVSSRLMYVQWALSNTANSTHTPLTISANWLITTTTTAVLGEYTSDVEAQPKPHPYYSLFAEQP